MEQDGGEDLIDHDDESSSGDEFSNNGDYSFADSDDVDSLASDSDYDIHIGMGELYSIYESMKLRLEHNDPDVSGISVQKLPWIKDSLMSRAGQAIGDNQVLKRLAIQTHEDGTYWLGALLEGLSRNRSIEIIFEQ